MTRALRLGLHRLADRDLQMSGVDPQAYFTDVLTRLVNLWPASRLDELMPWAWTGLIFLLRPRAASRYASSRGGFGVDPLPHHAVGPTRRDLIIAK